MKKTKDYCSLTPVFPDKAYLIYIFILHNGQLVALLPLDTIFSDPDTAIEGVKAAISQLDPVSQNMTILEECIIIPMQYQSLFSLKKEYWKKPVLHYSPQVRAKTFLPVIENPLFFSILVTPFVFDDTTSIWHFSAALPLINPPDTKEIEKFMYQSDHVVEIRAKNAAIYSLENKLRFNWKTGEFRKYDEILQKNAKKN